MAAQLSRFAVDRNPYDVWDVRRLTSIAVTCHTTRNTMTTAPFPGGTYYLYSSIT